MPDDKPRPFVRRKAGRPRVPDEKRLVCMHIRLPPAQFDRLARKALALHMSVAEVVRQELEGQRSSASARPAVDANQRGLFR
jgi:hypothetical protein